MTNERLDRPASASEISDKDLEIAQWRIDVTSDGDWKVDQIYGDFWEEKQNKKHFGKIFKAVVESGKLTGIHLIKHPDGSDKLSPDRQTLYRISKGAVTR